MGYQKILHICHSYGKLYENLISSLYKFDHKIFKYNLRYRRNLKEEKTNIMQYNNKCLIPGPLFYVRKLNNAKKWFEENININDIYLNHAHMLFSDGIIASKLKEKYNIPYIVAVRNTDLHSWFYWFFPHIKQRGIKALINAEKIIFLNKTYKDQLLSKIPTKLRKTIKEKSIIIPNGIDDFWIDNISMKKQSITNEKGFKIITVGRVEKNKNQITVSKALKKLQEKGFNVSYLIVGDVMDKKLSKKLLKDSFTKIHPYVKKNELLKLYRESNIYVMPSIKETFGLTYAEALSQSLPIIYSKNQGFDKQFEEGYVGYSVTSTKEDEIVTALLKIFAEYNKLSNNTKEAVYKFNLKNISEIYHQIYKSIIKTKREVLK